MKRPPPLPARVFFSLLLFTYPRPTRTRFSAEMRQFFEDSYRQQIGGSAAQSRIHFWIRTYWLLLANGLGSRLDLHRRKRLSRNNANSPKRLLSFREQTLDLVRNLKHAARTLRRDRGFALTSILTLGLAIGACTTIFCVVYPVLLAPLPYPDAEEIALLYEKSPGPEGQRGWASPLTVRDWQEQSRQFERIASYRLNLFTWTGGPEPALLRGWAVSPGYFPMMGLGMTLGRGFTEDEEQPGNHRVVVLAHAFWTQHFGGDLSVLGRSITLDGAQYTIVGVASPEIEFPRDGDYWVPAAIDRSREMRDFRYLGVIGRVRDGVTLEDAQAELAQISDLIAAEHPETNTGWSAELRGLRANQVAGVRPVLLGMSVAVGLLLVIAVGNVTNLTIGRSIGRQTDVAVRRALGASKATITRMFVTESLVIALLGGVLGVLLALWGTRGLLTVALQSLPRASSIAVDSRSVLFGLSAAAVVGLVLGVLSALMSMGGDLNETTKAGGRGGGSTAHAHRFREAVLTAQVGLALSLLIGATLLAQSLYELTRIDVGFSPENVLTFSYDLPGEWEDNAGSWRWFYRDVFERIDAVSGVQAAGAVTPLPMEMGSVPTSWTLSPQDDIGGDPSVMAHMRLVTPAYFDAMDIKLLSGRSFDDTDREDSQQVALVNRAFVNRYLNGRDALGTSITAGDSDADESDWSAIVGVVEDVRFRSLTAEGEPEIYIPMQQLPSGWGHLVVRATGPRDALVRAVTDAVHQIEPDLPLANIKSGAEIISDQSRVSRISATLTSLFAVIATAIAAVGILGMLSIVVAQRTREIGLRIALGAETRSIWRFMLFRGMRPVVFGLALGIGISLATTRFLDSQISNVSTLNPFAFLIPTLGFTLLGTLACIMPSVKASRVDPVRILQTE
jgi:putative ABC transport system permease protein